MKQACAFILVCLLSSCSLACDDSICLPQDEKQRLNSLNYSLTTEKLFKSYMSPDVGQRRLAEMYVVGVIDSSEGITWCGFGSASPDAIQEQVLVGLKNSLKANPNARAATAIKSQLEKLLPCKDAK